ncbi:crossover junction endonuclease MUS81 isoform X2 [Rhinatrema bivittatum]|uniref:crossover junction endonuclease MUS81 isoform X2 n=1 Tax=Rhinatrema bivittatum TaxID=194408 RepID=UPI00112BAB0C|nr:crossover junction endonuclease MUS81 isoform X2 [Rhinatrema bivittatum]
MPRSVMFGRKKPVLVCPNPLFLKWLTEWRDAAAEKGKQTQFVYQKAIRSLKKYPLPLRNGKEAKILQNFGDGICKMLDEKLEKHYAQHGTEGPLHSLECSKLDEMSTTKKRRKHTPLKDCSGDSLPVLPQEKKRKKKEDKKPRNYIPQKRSGAYAILLTLYRDSKSLSSRGYMLKLDLQCAAQPLCDKSFSLPDANSKYTAWSSVTTLIQKDFIIKTHSPARYSLTAKGLELAQKLEEDEQALVAAGVLMKSMDLGDMATKDQQLSGTSLLNETESFRIPLCRGNEAFQDQYHGPLGSNGGQGPYDHIPEFVLEPGQFNIVLCVDFIETTGGSSHRKQELVTELKKNGVDFDIRKLHIGDFLWIAQEQTQVVPGQPRAPQARELVLDHVVERKRIDDLSSSIIDGRFREQKFRLKRCGLRSPIYLVEDHDTSQHLSIPEATLQQAIVNTQVVDGFFIKRTKNVRESAAYLTLMTHNLQSLYVNKTLLSCTKEEATRCGQAFMPTANSCILMTFGEFSEGAVKNKAQTVREVFARQLMQISGISGEKAVAILNSYSTLTSLLEAYDQCSSVQDQEKLLFSIKCGKLQRNLGPVLSKTISQLYCTAGALS